MSEALAKPEVIEGAAHPLLLEMARAPVAVLREAQEAAAALKGVIDAKPKKVQFGGETYLEFEDWQTVGRFYGIAPQIISTTYVEFGAVAGWEARAVAIHVETGKIVSSADSMCLNDEEKWRARPKYEWHYVRRSGGTSLEDPGRDELLWEKAAGDGKARPRKTRVRLADEPVPLFQLRSMAQTRAAAKALRNALAWVVVLAGYKPTPAEEMDQAEPERPHPPPPEDEEPREEDPRPDPGPAESAELRQERRALLEKIRATVDERGLTPKQKRELWARHCGTATPETVDIGALSTLLDAVTQ